MLRPPLQETGDATSPIMAFARPQDFRNKVYLGRRKPNFADIPELDTPPDLPKIVVVLHGEPALRRATKRLGKAQGHLRADAAGTRQDAIQRGSSHTELCGKLATTKIVRLKINLDNELAGMGRIVHSHQ